MSNRLVGFNNTDRVKILVKEPLTKFSKLSGKDGILESHAHTDYHKLASQKCQDFLNTYKKPSHDILKQILENRERLIPIIKTIILHGTKNIPLRGHRDDGNLHKTNECKSNVNHDGNFKALLRYCIDGGDKVLENHIKTAGKNATYKSKTSTNELIQCCSNEILDIILQRIKLATFYCVIFDETTDVSHISQLSLSIKLIFKIL